METAAVPSSYMPRELQIPDGFDVILKDLTRAILREQPSDINRFCLSYFNKLKSAGETNDNDPAAALARMSTNEIQNLIADLFKENDKDNSGELDRAEFKGVFSQLQDTLGLDRSVVQRILSEADANEDGMISYEEFVPVATSIIESIVAKYRLREEEKLQEQAYADAHYEIHHGMPRDQLELILDKIFRKADKDNTNTLDAKEFEACLRSTELGLTRKEINVLMIEADQDKSESIDYEEFKPLCMEILVELAAQDWINEHKPDGDEEVTAFLTDLFASADVHNRKVLAHTEIMSLLLGADIGLTRIQVCSILSEAVMEEDGTIAYEEFISAACTMIMAFMNYKHRAGDAREVHWDKDDVEGRLLRAHPDPDYESTYANDDKTLTEISQLIEAALPELQPKYVTMLANLAEPTEGGDGESAALYSYSSVIDSAYIGLLQFDDHQNI